MLLTTLQKSSIPMDRCSAYAWERQAWCKWEACSAHKAFDGYLLEAWVLTFANNSCQKQNQEQNGNDSNRVFMLDFYPQFWTKAFDFEGRTKRIDYWKILLVNFILGIILLKFYHTEMHGGESVWNSLAVPATVKVGAPPSIVRCWMKARKSLILQWKLTTASKKTLKF